jgi:predicted nucleic acid-binding protein
MSFLVRNDDDAGKLLSEEMGFPIVGIIGTLFMAEYDWVLDFGKQEVQIPDTDVKKTEVDYVEGLQIG